MRLDIRSGPPWVVRSGRLLRTSSLTAPIGGYIGLQRVTHPHTPLRLTLVFALVFAQLRRRRRRRSNLLLSKSFHFHTSPSFPVPPPLRSPRPAVSPIRAEEPRLSLIYTLAPYSSPCSRSPSLLSRLAARHHVCSLPENVRSLQESPFPL